MNIGHPAQNSFKFGEIDPTFAGRFDTEFYNQGADTYKNFVTMLSTAALFRPGTVYVGNTEDSGYRTRLASMVKSSDTKFIIELGDGKTRVFKDHAHVTDVATSWSVADARTVCMEQVGNTLYCTHGDYATKRLTAVGTTVTWTVSDMVWTYNVTSGAASFEVAEHYPICLGHHNDRMYYGANNTNPQDFWASVVGEVSNITLGVTDDAGFNYRISSRDNRAIRWMQTHISGLMVGTYLGEGLLMDNAEGYVGPASPMKFRWVSEFGCSPLQGTPFDQRIMFVQQSLRALREFYPTADAYNSPALHYLAAHLFQSNIIDFAISREPWPMLWLVKADGKIALLSRSRETGVMAWSDIVTDGSFESVATIPGDNEDEVWVTVKRTVGGSTVRYVEYFKPFLETIQAAHHHVDCGVYVNHLSDVVADVIIQTPVAISAITRADPAVVTASGHSLSDGDIAYLDDVSGMAEVNGQLFTVTQSAGDVFALSGIDSTLYNTYISGGEAVIMPNIEVKTTTLLATLGWATGDHVRFTGLGGTTELNAFHYGLTSVGTSSFSIYTKTITHYTTWTAGGTMEKVVASVSGLAHLASEVVAVTVEGAFHASKTVAVSEVALDAYYNKIHIGKAFEGHIKSMNLNPILKATKATKVQVLLHNTLGGEVGQDEDDLESMIFRSGSEVASTAEWHTGAYVHHMVGDLSTETQLNIKQKQSLPMTVLAFAVREGVLGG